MAKTAAFSCRSTSHCKVGLPFLLATAHWVGSLVGSGTAGIFTFIRMITN